MTLYFKNDLLHREDGPAVIRVGRLCWFIEGLRHRLGGPAIIYNHEISFFVHGEQVSALEAADLSFGKTPDEDSCEYLEKIAFLLRYAT